MERVKTLISGKRLTHVRPDMTVSEAAARMADAKIGAVLVLDNGNLAGIFTERDLLIRVVSVGKDPQKTRISEVMTKQVAVCDADDTYENCLAQMREVGCRHMPIVKGDRLLGVLSIRDLLRHHISVKDAEIKMMNSLYHYQPPNMEH
jgi:CBS domain-containing protein